MGAEQIVEKTWQISEKLRWSVSFCQHVVGLAWLCRKASGPTQITDRLIVILKRGELVVDLVKVSLHLVSALVDWE